MARRRWTRTHDNDRVDQALHWQWCSPALNRGILSKHTVAWQEVLAERCHTEVREFLVGETSVSTLPRQESARPVGPWSKLARCLQSHGAAHQKDTPCLIRIAQRQTDCRSCEIATPVLLLNPSIGVAKHLPSIANQCPTLFSSVRLYSHATTPTVP